MSSTARFGRLVRRRLVEAQIRLATQLMKVVVFRRCDDEEGPR